VLGSQPAHKLRVSKVTILPCVCALLVLTLVVILARTIVLLARMLFSTKTTVVLTVTHRKFVVSKTRMRYIPVRNPWPPISSEPVTGFLVSPSPDYQPGDEKAIKSHCCRPLLNCTAPPTTLLYYLSPRPYLTTIPCSLATPHAQPRWTPLL
jgi:hypothetical protein